MGKKSATVSTFSTVIMKGILPYFLVAFLVIGVTGKAFSQQYPVKPITLVGSSSAGGPTDLTARAIAESTKEFLGQEIVVINKPGAGHMVAMGYIISAKPDGYTLYGSVDVDYIEVPHMVPLDFNPLRDTTPIIRYGTGRGAIVVRSDSPFKSIKDVIDFARENPG
jgi:tripartite-type tricarboxylate transporter receptor subunit TctC